MDPDPARDDYYRKVYAPYLKRLNLEDAPWRPPLRASLMLLPDLLIAHYLTGKPRYLDFYRQVVDRFKDNPDVLRPAFKDSSPVLRAYVMGMMGLHHIDPAFHRLAAGLLGDAEAPVAAEAVLAMTRIAPREPALEEIFGEHFRKYGK